MNLPLERYCSASRGLVPKALLARTRIGEIELAAIDVASVLFGHTITRTPGNEAVLLIVEDQSCHECVTVQDGREARLRVGDFTLCETTRPYEVYAAADPCRMLVAGMPRALLQRYVPCPEEVTAVAMPARDRLNGLVSDYLRSLWARFADGSPLSDAWQVCQATLSLIASAYAGLPRAKPARRSAASAHRARIRTHVERYLTDPDLTPTTVARACQINVRYMHRLYAREEETLGQYILRRRLEECARALRSPNRGRSITEIAFAYGFKSATHFGRAFRDRYHLTPGDYQRVPHQT